MLLRRRIRRTRSGSYQVRLPPEERRILQSLPGQLRELIDDPDRDPSLARLFPPAYAGDVMRDAEYQVMMGDELVERRRAQIALLEETVDRDELSDEELASWMRCLNDIRLVLGTQLDVSEDMVALDDDDPRAPAFALYGYLSWLLEQIVDAMSGALPDVEDDD
ncbi:MAG: DUF2017 family protein [Acidimicrobiia bacterium]